ncbi:MAG: UDP-N-acetylmuramate dehydrogenase [Anaerolineales bacterium]
MNSEQRAALQAAFKDQMQADAPLAPFTSARIGGPAEVLISVRDADELVNAVRTVWAMNLPFVILGGGSNVLVSDLGVPGVVILNKARRIEFLQDQAGLKIKAESGASLGSLARRAAERGWSGLEWAATVPGTVGGAVVGNAGAHGGDTAGDLEMAEILQRNQGVEAWPAEKLAFEYRGSWLKRNPGQAVVVSATFELTASTPEACKAKIQEFVAHRQETQPAGASMGSMFKNPPGDFAGKLIDQAGLKGLKHGGAQISQEHANFFVNLGDARAIDVYELIEKARQEVRKQFGIDLELEIELIGDWKLDAEHKASQGAAA